MADALVKGLEMEAWAGLVLTHDTLMREMESSLTALGLAGGEYEVLRALDDAGRDGIRMSDLAAHRFMSTGGLTRLVDRLEGRELLERCRVEGDKRSFVAKLTPAGRRTLKRARERHHEDIRRLFVDKLDEDQMRVLARVWEQLGEKPGDAAC